MLVAGDFWGYNNYVRITFDPAKRAWTLRERAIDFADAVHVFGGRRLHVADHRQDYGEPRLSDDRIPGRAHGDGCLGPAPRCSTRYFDEEMQ